MTKNIKKEDNCSNSLNENELEQLQNIVNIFNIKFHFYDLKAIDKRFINAFEVSDNLVYFYPLNDGFPTCSFEFYKDGKLIIKNDKEYCQLANLDDILIQMVRIFNKALDNEIVLDPYYFMIELSDEINKDYCGNANLVITDRAIRNQKLDEKTFDEAKIYFINQFLDHFIGWNFGLSVNRNEELKQELEELNTKVINMGIRKYAGAGFNVFGCENEVNDGLQHYKLSTEKENNKKKLLKN